MAEVDKSNRDDLGKNARPDSAPTGHAALSPLLGLLPLQQKRAKHELERLEVCQKCSHALRACSQTCPSDRQIIGSHPASCDAHNTAVAVLRRLKKWPKVDEMPVFHKACELRIAVVCKSYIVPDRLESFQRVRSDSTLNNLSSTSELVTQTAAQTCQLATVRDTRSVIALPL